MTRIERIYLDIDDVLADCTVEALRHMGVHNYQREDHPDVGRCIEDALFELTEVRLSPKQFWEHFNKRWWANLRLTDWCYELIHLAAQTVGKDEVYLLTTPTKCSDCHGGKFEWIEQHMPDWLKRQYNITPRKRCCAYPGAVLIDDADENADAFRNNRKPGPGHCILLPQPWNAASHHMGREIDYVGETLDQIQRDRCR